MYTYVLVHSSRSKFSSRSTNLNFSMILNLVLGQWLHALYVKFSSVHVSVQHQNKYKYWYDCTAGVHVLTDQYIKFSTFTHWCDDGID
jgi:hypothetical protein